MAYVIAEIGFNHGGDVGLAVEMVQAASGAGADAVKFQSFYASDLCFPRHESYPVFKAGELSEEGHVRVIEAADTAGADFLSTPFSVQWVDVLDRLDVMGFKIASMDLNNPVLQDAIAAKGRPVYLSTGAGRPWEVNRAVDRMRAGGVDQLTVFHCVSKYPTRPEEAMLWMIPLMKETLGVRVGFSDHTLGIEAPVKAVSYGAEVIEKHFTIDKGLPGPDHAISADPDELRALMDALKNVEPAEPPSPPPGWEEMARPDEAARRASRRGIYAARDIAEGEVITLDMLNLVRPEVTPLEKLEEILGKPALHSLCAGQAF